MNETECLEKSDELATTAFSGFTRVLAPKIVAQVAEFLRELKRRGIAVLLVEQKLTIALEVAERCLVMGHGQIVFDGTPDALRADADIRKEWLEV